MLAEAMADAKVSISCFPFNSPLQPSPFTVHVGHEVPGKPWNF